MNVYLRFEACCFLQVPCCCLLWISVCSAGSVCRGAALSLLQQPGQEGCSAQEPCSCPQLPVFSSCHFTIWLGVPSMLNWHFSVPAHSMGLLLLHRGCCCLSGCVFLIGSSFRDCCGDTECWAWSLGTAQLSWPHTFGCCHHSLTRTLPLTVFNSCAFRLTERQTRHFQLRQRVHPAAGGAHAHGQTLHHELGPE